jgi:isoleucyl-tRNA synthetase
MVPPLLMDEVDRFAMARYGELASKIMAAYERYDFPAIVQAHHHHCLAAPAAGRCRRGCLRA